MSRKNTYDYESGYKSGYRDGSIHYELEHCPACKNIADLQKALIENYRLRELMRIMHGELVSCEDNGYVCGGHKFDDRVRELGVEVD